MTPPCWKCSNAECIRLSTRQVVYCPDCNTYTRWRLKPGQRPLINSQRGDKRQ